MLEKFKNHISLEKFLQDCNGYKWGKSGYDISYTEFLKYFDNIKKISKHNLIISINFTYGRMPTIFDFRSNDFDQALVILNNAKQWLIPTIEELKILKGLLNNSLVGTSKLLHFINPDKFAIWDSRVCRYLTWEKVYNHRIWNCKTYLSYLDFCNYLTQKKEYEYIHKYICQKKGYPMTKLRTVELIMFLNGGSN